MGNVCCMGRTGHTPQNNENSMIKDSEFHNKKKSDHRRSFEQSDSRRESKRISSPKNSKPAVQWQNLFSQHSENKKSEENTAKIQKPILASKLEKIEEERKSIEDNYKSDLYETQGFLIDYDLEEATNYTKSDQRKIIQILDNYQEELEDGDIEELDGLIEDANMNGVLITMMFTTHAIYILNSEEWSSVTRRVPFESIKAMSLAAKGLSVLFHIEPEDGKYNDILISSERYNDIIKATEQLYYECTGDYVQWNVAESKNDLFTFLNKPINKEFTSEDKNLTKVFVRYGEIGEKKLKLQLCSTSSESFEFDKYFLLTNKGIYILKKDFGMIDKVFLENIRKIGKDSVQRSIIVYDVDKSFYFKLPLVIADDIQEAALAVGNSKIKELDLDSESYLSVTNN
ncbi:unnamed protein product [Blepharisma stoltei]|uniref:Uncharacterized protein n=1 Tax=Blepharisma stoltei TaxID=1481888 RepID=A0AAU9IMP1_9CILI|nr:unnamed protein product [Blepharisma stoltei]